MPWYCRTDGGGDDGNQSAHGGVRNGRRFVYTINIILNMHKYIPVSRVLDMTFSKKISPFGVDFRLVSSLHILGKFCPLVSIPRTKVGIYETPPFVGLYRGAL